MVPISDMQSDTTFMGKGIDTQSQATMMGADILSEPSIARISQSEDKSANEKDSTILTHSQAADSLGMSNMKDGSVHGTVMEDSPDKKEEDVADGK